MPQVAWHTDDGRYFSVLECNRYMLENEVACDVTFEVAPPGEPTETVHAHRYMLIARSPVFKAMFCGAMAMAGDQVTIRDVQPGAFRKIIKYLYCESIEVTEEDVFDIIYAAKKYLVDPVVLKCMEFLNSHVTTETVCPILTYAIFFDDDDLVKKCLLLVGVKTREVLESDTFQELSKEAIGKIVESQVLNISESELFEACLGWCKAECGRNGEQYNPDSLKRHLAASFYHFRLLDISEDLLHSCILGSGMLTSEEEEGVSECLLKGCGVAGEVGGLSRFTQTPRRRVAAGEHQCDLVTKCSGSINTFNRPMSHTFKVSQDILLHGLDIVDAPHSFINAVQLAILQDSQTVYKTVLSVTAARRTAAFGLAISIFLPKHINLHAGEFEVKLHFRSMGGNATIGYCRPPPEGVETNGVRFQMSCPDVFHIGGLRFSVV